jgi:hypothetical protein
LDVTEGAMVAVSLAGDVSHLRVKVRPGLSPGVAGMVAGLGGSIGNLLPVWGALTIDSDAAAAEADHDE